MKRSVLILATFASFVVASLAFISADEPRYKNLKILKKNISKKELDSVMHFFSMSLGERCNFCHVRNEETKSIDFASEANPNKGVTRFMMRMNAKINKKYFKNTAQENKAMNLQAVTCYTCHHGKGHPEVKAPANGNNMPPPPPGGMRPARDSAGGATKM